MRLVVALLPILVLTGAEYKSYEGYKVLRTSYLDEAKTKNLYDLMMTSGLDFWKEPRVGQTADIMIPPERLDWVKGWLGRHNIDYHTMIDNLRQPLKPKSTQNSTLNMNWDDYQSHDTLNAWIDSLASENSAWARVESIGKSYEGRDMNVLILDRAGPGKPNVWLEAGIHAREWIAPAVATYIVNELVNNDADHPEYLDNINWYFIPSANPDGYEYSRDHERFWRKTRKPNEGSSCKGTDPNRNWGYHWAENGVSFDPCSEIYPGKEAFDNPEMANIRDYVQTLDPMPVLGHCFHSYSQLWLWPYGYAYDVYPDNWQEIEQLAIDASDALYDVHGTYFEPENSASLYPAAGASDDWYKSIGMRYSFTTELRDTGYYGFDLPPEQIIPSGEEMWAAFKVVIARIQEP